MTEQELERALRAALPPLDPEPQLVEQIMARIDRSPAPRADTPPAMAAASTVGAMSGRTSIRRHWLPAAIAAAALITFGFTQWAQQQRQRQLQLRAQLLQGLTIASASLQDARNVVLHGEDSIP